MTDDIRRGLIGDEEGDVGLVHKLMEELDILAQLATVAAESETTSEHAVQAERKLLTLLDRCLAVATRFPACRGEMEEVINRVASATSEVLRAVGDECREDALVKVERFAQRAAGGGGATAEEADSASEPTPIPAPTLPATPAPKAAPAAATPAQTTSLPDSEIVSRLAEFYEHANPEKTLDDIKKMWEKYGNDPPGFHNSLTKKYPESAHLVEWLPGQTARTAQTSTPEKPKAAKAKAASPSQETPRRGGGAVTGFFSAIATPVVKMFIPQNEEDNVPQAILPDASEEANNGYFDKDLGRYVFPNDIEGEKERAELAAMMAGPPPPPSAKKPSTTTASTGGYVDAFNSAPAGGGGGGEAKPMPPMPPMPQN